MDKDFYVKAEGINEDLGLVFGYAIICQENGVDYFDVQGDHVPEDAMTKASLDFMKNSRMADDMHDFKEQGTVVFAFPMTADVAKSLGITVQKTGLIIGMHPSDEVLTKFKNGTYKGFSIGGRYITSEDVK